MGADFKVSVIVAVYNAEKYLRQCIDTILVQTYKNLDIVLVNDGSKDNSLEICKEYAARDNRINVINKENGGPVSAYKTGTLEAKGEYVIYISDDDTVAPTYIEELAEANKNGEYDLIISRLNDSNGVIYQNSLPAGEYTFDDIVRRNDANKESRILENLATFFFSKLHRTSIAAEVYNNADLSIIAYSDCAFAFSYITRCKRMRIIENCGYCWRTYDDSLTRKADTLYMQMANIYKFYLSMIKDASKHNLREHLEAYIIRRVSTAWLCIIFLMYHHNKTLPNAEEMEMPYKEIQKTKIAIHGAGKFGLYVYEMIKRMGAEIAIWTDRRYKDIQNMPIKISPVEELKRTEFDFAIIAAANENNINEIRQDLMSFGVPYDKIIRLIF